MAARICPMMGAYLYVEKEWLETKRGKRGMRGRVSFGGRCIQAMVFLVFQTPKDREELWSQARLQSTN